MKQLPRELSLVLSLVRASSVCSDIPERRSRMSLHIMANEFLFL